MTPIEQQATDYVWQTGRPTIKDDPYYDSSRIAQSPQSHEWCRTFQREYDRRFGDIYIRTLRQTGKIQ